MIREIFLSLLVCSAAAFSPLKLAISSLEGVPSPVLELMKETEFDSKNSANGLLLAAIASAASLQFQKSKHCNQILEFWFWRARNDLLSAVSCEIDFSLDLKKVDEIDLEQFLLVGEDHSLEIFYFETFGVDFAGDTDCLKTTMLSWYARLKFGFESEIIATKGTSLEKYSARSLREKAKKIVDPAGENVFICAVSANEHNTTAALETALALFGSTEIDCSSVVFLCADSVSRSFMLERKFDVFFNESIEDELAAIFHSGDRTCNEWVTKDTMRMVKWVQTLANAETKPRILWAEAGVVASSDFKSRAGVVALTRPREVQSVINWGNKFSSHICRRDTSKPLPCFTGMCASAREERTWTLLRHDWTEIPLASSWRRYLYSIADGGGYTRHIDGGFSLPDFGQSEFVVMMDMDWKFIELFLNSLVNLHSWGLTENIVAVPYDKKSYDWLKKNNFIIAYNETILSDLEAKMKSSDCAYFLPLGVGHVRGLVKQQLLHRGTPVFQIDTDAYLHEDITRYLSPNGVNVINSARFHDHGGDESTHWVKPFVRGREDLFVHLSAGQMAIYPNLETIELYHDLFYDVEVPNMCKFTSHSSFAQNLYLYEEGLRLNETDGRPFWTTGSVRGVNFIVFSDESSYDFHLQPTLERRILSHPGVRQIADKISWLTFKGCWDVPKNWEYVIDRLELESKIPPSPKTIAAAIMRMKGERVGDHHVSIVIAIFSPETLECLFSIIWNIGIVNVDYTYATVYANGLLLQNSTALFGHIELSGHGPMNVTTQLENSVGERVGQRKEYTFDMTRHCPPPKGEVHPHPKVLQAFTETPRTRSTFELDTALDEIQDY